MEEKTGEELVRAYAKNYQLSPDAVTEEMVMRHWTLEQELTRELLSSSPEERWETFERCYSTLYSELPWLNELPRNTDDTDPSLLYDAVISLVNPEAKTVYEIGSGKGTLIKHLAGRGYQCKATEITRERGKKWVDDTPNLTWGATDGVHLDRFEEHGHWDVVILNNVVEHMHPDDLIEHFRAVHKILSPGGRYIIGTPHIISGPTDVSRVFGYETAAGMHLKEYTYGELVSQLRDAGFKRFSSCLRVPRRIAKVKPRESRLYLRYLRAMETVLGMIPGYGARRKALKLSKLLLFQSYITLAADKDR